MPSYKTKCVWPSKHPLTYSILLPVPPTINAGLKAAHVRPFVRLSRLNSHEHWTILEGNFMSIFSELSIVCSRGITLYS